MDFRYCPLRHLGSKSTVRSDATPTGVDCAQSLADLQGRMRRCWEGGSGPARLSWLPLDSSGVPILLQREGFRGGPCSQPHPHVAQPAVQHPLGPRFGKDSHQAPL